MRVVKKGDTEFMLALEREPETISQSTTEEALLARKQD